MLRKKNNTVAQGNQKEIVIALQLQKTGHRVQNVVLSEYSE
jgi:hypothetical protein